MSKHLLSFNEPVVLKDLGIQDYLPTWEAMKKFTLDRDNSTQDELWFVQHPAVYTLGLNGKNEHILNPTNIPVINIDRGGQVTYHAPGQLIVYCMIDLNRCGYGIQVFVRRLQTSIQTLLKEYKIQSHLVSKAPGVYLEDKKIAAIGLRVKRNCTYHGLSINVDMDLTPFKNINPCGYPDLEVTQLSDYGIIDSIDSIVNKFKPILINTLYE